MKKINIDAILETMRNVFSDTIPEVSSVVEEYLTDSKERLTNLAEGAISGELSYAFVTRRLKEEPITVKNYLLSVGQIVSALVEKKVTDAIDVFEKGIKTFIPDTLEGEVIDEPAN